MTRRRKQTYHWVKVARTCRLGDLTRSHQDLEYKAAFLEKLRAEKIRETRTKPNSFFEEVLGFKLTVYQKQLVHLFEENHFVAARWCRQSGKSSTVSGLLLHYALTHPGCHIAVIGPSWRQTKLNIQRINRFLPRLPRQSYLKPQRTKLIVNDSTIEAFPNNPNTIRGQTLHVIWWDEVNFTADDQDLYDAMLFATTTTDSRFICTSTPWNRDSLFWRMCNDESFSEFKVSHVTYEQAMEPKIGRAHV